MREQNEMRVLFVPQTLHASRKRTVHETSAIWGIFRYALTQVESEILEDSRGHDRGFFRTGNTQHSDGRRPCIGKGTGPRT